MECAEVEDSDAAVVDVVPEPRLGDVGFSFTNIVGFFFPESNLRGPVFDILSVTMVRFVSNHSRTWSTRR